MDKIPEDIKALMTDLQLLTLANLEGFGWSIQFVRRPLFQEQVIVIVDPSGEQYAILTEDGEVDRDANLTLR